MNSRRTTAFKKAWHRCRKMFQLSLDTLLPVWRCCYESITAERWERTVAGWQGAYRTVEWKMWKRWMKKSGMSLSAGLNGEFPTVAHFTLAASRYAVKVTGGWAALPPGAMIMWFSGVTFDSVTALDNFHRRLLTLFCLAFFVFNSSGLKLTSTFLFGTVLLSFPD